MEDKCSICMANIATITLGCGHRTSCSDCYNIQRDFDQAAGRATRCPICAQRVVRVDDTTRVQLRPVTLRAARVDEHEQLTVGIRMFGGEELANDEVLDVVRQAMAAVNAGTLQLRDLKRALHRLPMDQFNLVFLTLIEDTNLRPVLRKLDQRLCETYETRNYVQRMVVHTVTGTDTTALVSRAAVATIGQTLMGILTGGFNSLSQATFAVDGAASGLIFCVFSLFEVYRWSNGEITGRTALRNVGEHLAGALGSVGGCYAGCAAGAAIGTAICPVAGTFIGGIIGAICGSLAGDFLARNAYRTILPRERVTVEVDEVVEEHRLSPLEVAQKAARKIRVNIREHNFDEAKARFRTALLENHPDKFQGQGEEVLQRQNQEIQDILACWTIVRQYYHDHKREEIDENGQEGFFTLNVLKVYEAASNTWKYVRCWFGNVGLGREVDPAVEEVSTVTIYL